MYKDKKTIEKEFDEEFTQVGKYGEHEVQLFSGSTDDIKSFIHKVREDDIRGLIEWLNDKIKTPRTLESKTPEEKLLKAVQVNAYNIAIRDTISHLQSLLDNNKEI